jgi:pimeloyl-ACP methyl ester carboxylesterase
MPEITLPQGTIHYRDSGDGPPIVFVHGLLVDGALWRKVTPLLDGEARTIVPDLPLGSHRLAMNADAELSPATVARLVGDLLAALDLEDVTLVGNDTGGAISQLVALDHGERLGRLVLTNCDCFEVFPPKEFVPMVKAARVPGALYAAVQPMRAAAARRSPLAYGWLAHEIPDEVTGAWIQPFLDDADVRRDAATFMKAIDKGTMLDAAARLPSLKIPSLVVWGQDDRFFSAELGRRLAATLPNARLEPIAGARTFVSEDAPEALADAIRGFVREGAPQAA